MVKAAAACIERAGWVVAVADFRLVAGWARGWAADASLHGDGRAVASLAPAHAARAVEAAAIHKRA
jgi:hypothetical protein